MSDLLPCPFCGRQPHQKQGKMWRSLIQSWHDQWEEENYPFHVVCNSCDIKRTGNAEREREDQPIIELYAKARTMAISNWNTRVTSPPVPSLSKESQ